MMRYNVILKWLLVPLLIMIVGISILAHVFHHAEQPSRASSRFIHDSATSDTSVETLKTLTAEISAVQQQNQSLIAENKALTEQDKTTLANFKSDVLAQVQQQLSQYQATPTQGNQNSLPSHVIPQADNAMTPNDTQWIWIDDMQKTPKLDTNSNDVSAVSSTPDLTHLFKTENISTQNNSTDLSTFDNHDQKLKKPSIPYYTIPVNATLTGAIAMMPIIGRIPIDGKVPDPYTFKVIMGPKNLAANGVDIPSDIQGIVASGVAEGDLLGRCARGDIESMTFVFQDGRISTTEAKTGESLGTIAEANGNPCIAGSFHTDAPLFLGVTAGLSGIQGYGNALSQAQLSHTTTDTGATIASLIGSSNKYAFGQGFSAASQAAQQWWNQRVSSSFDFIYVPNVDLKTGKLLKLNINITQPIAIDYNIDARKVFYAHDENALVHALD